LFSPVFTSFCRGRYPSTY